MPIPFERIKTVENEIEREAKAKKEDNNINHDHDDDDHIRHTTAMTPPDQDFSFLTNGKRSVHYDIEPANDLEYRPLRRIPETDQTAAGNVLRRRYIAHWGLPGTLTYYNTSLFERL